jgi:hypothetical protein
MQAIQIQRVDLAAQEPTSEFELIHTARLSNLTPETRHLTPKP